MIWSKGSFLAWRHECSITWSLRMAVSSARCIKCPSLCLISSRTFSRWYKRLSYIFSCKIQKPDMFVPLDYRTGTAYGLLLHKEGFTIIQKNENKELCHQKFCSKLQKLVELWIVVWSGIWIVVPHDPEVLGITPVSKFLWKFHVQYVSDILFVLQIWDSCGISWDNTKLQ